MSVANAEAAAPSLLAVHKRTRQRNAADTSADPGNVEEVTEAWGHQGTRFGDNDVC